MHTNRCVWDAEGYVLEALKDDPRLDPLDFAAMCFGQARGGMTIDSLTLQVLQDGRVPCTCD